MTRLNGRNLWADAATLGSAVGLGLRAMRGSGADLVIPGRSRARAIVTDAELVDSVDVAIIGGGFVGVATALTLAQRGVSVALFEKGVIAGEASGRSAGWVERMFQSPQKLELAEFSHRLWRDVNALTGEETGYRPDQLAAFFETDEEIEMARAWLTSVKGLPNGDARLISAQEAHELMPGRSGQWKGALLSTGEAKVEPTLAAPAMALGARKLGARIYQNCAVRGLDLEGGRVAGVVTEKGRVKARTAILAGGVWSPLFAGSLGLDVPQFSAYATMASIAPIPDGPELSAILPGAILRRELDGGYTGAEPNAVGPVTPSSIREVFRLMPALQAMGPMIAPALSWRDFWRELRTPRRWPLDAPSPFERIRILEPAMIEDRVVNGWASIAKAHPAFRNVTIRERWTGALCTTLDNMPVISEASEVPGLILGAGLYYGLTWGPGAGHILADLATGVTPPIDIARFRYSRFSDGSQLEFQA